MSVSVAAPGGFGGLVGVNQENGGTVSNSYATGAVGTTGYTRGCMELDKPTR